MNYKEKYEKLEKFIKDLYPFMSDYCKEKTEGMIPELKESDDERIRKAIFKALSKKDARDVLFENGIQVSDALAWLEKQKPVNKVKPKFKVGDWVVCNYSSKYHGGNQIVQVEKLDDERFGYTLDDGTYFSGSFENNYHLWTIEDINEGDVLYSHNSNILWIYKNKTTYHAAMVLNYAQYNCISTNCDIVIPSDTCPATKHQCELLFSKIKESGYEWDYYNKELKKIEQVSAWSEEDNDMDAKIETNQKNEHNTAKCEYCLTVFKYNNSELEEEEDRDMRGYHYYYYAKCPKCGNRIFVKED